MCHLEGPAEDLVEKGSTVVRLLLARTATVNTILSSSSNISNISSRDGELQRRYLHGQLSGRGSGGQALLLLLLLLLHDAAFAAPLSRLQHFPQHSRSLLRRLPQRTRGQGR